MEEEEEGAALEAMKEASSDVHINMSMSMSISMD